MECRADRAATRPCRRDRSEVTRDLDIKRSRALETERPPRRRTPTCPTPRYPVATSPSQSAGAGTRPAPRTQPRPGHQNHPRRHTPAQPPRLPPMIQTAPRSKPAVATGPGAGSPLLSVQPGDHVDHAGVGGHRPGNELVRRGKYVERAVVGGDEVLEAEIPLPVRVVPPCHPRCRSGSQVPSPRGELIRSGESSTVVWWGGFPGGRCRRCGRSRRRR